MRVFRNLRVQSPYFLLGIKTCPGCEKMTTVKEVFRAKRFKDMRTGKIVTWEQVVKIIAEYFGSHKCSDCEHHKEMMGCPYNHSGQG
jgi:hypothetical protein